MTLKPDLIKKLDTTNKELSLLFDGVMNEGSYLIISSHLVKSKSLKVEVEIESNEEENRDEFIK